MATVTAAQFNRDVSAAKRAAAQGPVFVTYRGRATHVLLTMADYEAQVGGRTLLEALHPGWLNAPGVVAELELPVRDELPRAAELA
ncbi:MAG: type II toxin-antitoxin system Phd/YefM family antitoxin [Bifidobacteriaceae bacterium]|jgi:PHD/YefM family antitoxin component YafN of YafNO toxin-antitoxin module|nr:type II toxin-antitoxin system Phd/YefM family antitoxin [Bifidobacteriaceae bacterium]